MPEWSKFTDDEIVLIKHKMNVKFEKGMIVTLLLSPIICLAIPYIPGKRGRGPMIDRMPYWDAVLQISIIWILALMGIWIWNYFKSINQLSQNRRFLKKKILIGDINNITKGNFMSFKNYIETNIDNEFDKLEVGKDELINYKIGDKVEIEFEEHTKTVLRITKVEMSGIY